MFGFSAPHLLFATLLLALPVALHLLKRQLAINLRFPSIRFIIRGRLPREGKRRLRDILLLILRLALFAALVLCAARPFWAPPVDAGPQTAAGAPNLVVLLDTSASMRGHNRFQAARQAIGKHLQARTYADYALVTTGPATLDLAPTPAADTFLANLESLEPGYAAGNVSAALERAAALLPAGRKGTLLIASDFQIHEWELASLPALPGHVALELVGVGPEAPENAAIMAAHTQQLPDGRIRIVADLHNFGTQAIGRLVSLEAGTQRLSRRIDIPARSAAKVPFVMPPAETRHGRLLLEPDDQPIDDSLSLWLGAPPPIRLLAVVPFEDEPEKSTELFFLKKALSIRPGSAARGFSLEAVDVRQFFALTPAGFDAVAMLGAVGYLEEPGLELLRRSVEAGATVLCTPGRAAGTQFLALNRLGLLSAVHRGVQTFHGLHPVRVAWINPDGLLAGLFSNPRESDLFRFGTTRLVRLATQAPCEELLRADNELPLLVRQSTGLGQLLATAFALDPAWSEFPLTTSFLPFLHELFSMSGTDEGIRRLNCGDPLPVVTNLLGEASKPPAGASTETPVVIMVGNTPVVVNVPRTESTPQRQSLLALRDKLTARDGAEPAAMTDPAGRTRILWPWLAAAAALLLLAEFALGNIAAWKATAPPPSRPVRREGAI